MILATGSKDSGNYLSDAKYHSLKGTVRSTATKGLSLRMRNARSRKSKDDTKLYRTILAVNDPSHPPILQALEGGRDFSLAFDLAKFGLTGQQCFPDSEPRCHPCLNTGYLTFAHGTLLNPEVMPIKRKQVAPGRFVPEVDLSKARLSYKLYDDPPTQGSYVLYLDSVRGDALWQIGQVLNSWPAEGEYAFQYWVELDYISGDVYANKKKRLSTQLIRLRQSLSFEKTIPVLDSDSTPWTRYPTTPACVKTVSR